MLNRPQFWLLLALVIIAGAWLGRTAATWVLALHFQQPLQRWRPYITFTFQVTPGWVEGGDHD